MSTYQLTIKFASKDDFDASVDAISEYVEAVVEANDIVGSAEITLGNKDATLSGWYNKDIVDAATTYGSVFLAARTGQLLDPKDVDIILDRDSGEIIGYLYGPNESLPLPLDPDAVLYLKRQS